MSVPATRRRTSGSRTRSRASPASSTGTASDARRTMIEPPVSTPAGVAAPPPVAGFGPDDTAAKASALSSFLITDIEGSTRLWEEQGAAMAGALALHDALLRSVVEGRGGTVIKTTGDGLLAVFGEPIGALTAALDAQRALRDADWGEIGALRVRMA